MEWTNYWQLSVCQVPNKNQLPKTINAVVDIYR